MIVFDRALLMKRRQRAVTRFAAHNFLYTEVGERLMERLGEIRRDFPHALNLGALDGSLTQQLQQRPDIQRITSLEACAGFAPTVVGEEELLPFHGSTFDLIISNLTLQWVNDLPGALIQAAQALKPDGLFMASLVGGDTLVELRTCLMEAELELTGSMTARTSPLTEVRDAGGLLQRAQLALPVVDRETITVTYAHPYRLIEDLRGMAATHVPLREERRPLRRDVLGLAQSLYQKRFADSEGRVPATFEILYLAGWAPHESQQKPLARGSAQHALADALKKLEPKSPN